MKIYVDDSHAGNGKTTRQTQRLAAFPIRAIYSCERVEMFGEIIQQINDHAAQTGIAPNIIDISRLNTKAVKRRVESLVDEQHPDHTIVLVTHAALMLADFSRFSGWSLTIDEVPSLLKIAHVRTDTSHVVLRDLYDLVPTDHTGWSEILPSRAGKAKSNADVQSDDFAAPLSPLHRDIMAADRGFGKVIARLPNWNEASKKQKWFYSTWFSFWNFEAFDSLTVLGNGFMNSVDVQLVRKFDDAIAADRGQTVEWIPLQKPASQKVKPRKITMRFFQVKHATATALSKPAGKRNLVKIAQYLNSVLPADAIWSGNNGVDGKAKAAGTILTDDEKLSVIETMSKHMSIKPISPRLAGSNKYRHVHAMAFIFTANSSSDCTAFLKLNGLDASSWRSTKEHETILQGLTRTSIRDADSDHDVEFYVMDRADAQYCADYFTRLGHDVRVEFVDLNLEKQDDLRSTNGAKPNPILAAMTAEEREARDRASATERQRAHRARAKAEELANRKAA